jgi:holdfast attachment protein HfaA
MASSTFRRIGALAAFAGCTLAGAAHAQSMSTNSASFNAGWGRNPGDENRAVDPNTRDANGNRVIINGVMQSGADQSFFAQGAASAFAGAGAGAGGATAIGNNLTVITQGNYNVVVVDSTQTNSGDVTATTSTQKSGNGS